MALPLAMGHETVGEVLALGPMQAQGVAVGEARLIYPWIGCGVCEVCRAGDENLCPSKPRCLGVHCDGGYADHIVVPHPRYLLDLRRSRSGHGGSLRLLGRHHLWRAEEGRVRAS